MMSKEGDDDVLSHACDSEVFKSAEYKIRTTFFM